MKFAPVHSIIIPLVNSSLSTLSARYCNCPHHHALRASAQSEVRNQIPLSCNGHGTAMQTSATKDAVTSRQFLPQATVMCISHNMQEVLDTQTSDPSDMVP